MELDKTQLDFQSRISKYEKLTDALTSNETYLMIAHGEFSGAELNEMHFDLLREWLLRYPPDVRAVNAPVEFISQDCGYWMEFIRRYPSYPCGLHVEEFFSEWEEAITIALMVGWLPVSYFDYMMENGDCDDYRHDELGIRIRHFRCAQLWYSV